jgi:tight adherence protein B
LVSHPLILAGFVAVALGGLAFALSSGDSKAKKRQAALQKGAVKTKDNAVEKVARKKQIADSLKDLEKRRGQTRLTLEMKIQQAGLSLSRQQFIIFSVVGALIFAFMVFLASNSLYIAGPA